MSWPGISTALAAVLGVALAAGCKQTNPLYNYGGVVDGGRVDRVPSDGSDAEPADAKPVDAEPADAEPANLAVPPPDSGPVGTDASDPDGPVDGPSLPPDQAPPLMDMAPAEVAGLPLLIGHWPLNGNANDVSGNNLHGFLEGQFGFAPWVGTGRGGGLSFPVDGDNQVGVRVGPPGPVPALISRLKTFTIAAWTQRAANAGLHQSVMSRQYLDTGAEEVLNLTYDAADVILYLHTNPPGRTWDARATLGAAEGALFVWVHVAATYDGSTLLAYANGVVGTRGKTYSGDLLPSSLPLYIGTNRNPGAASQPFQGILDEVLLFSEALNASQIRNLMNGVLPVR